jgi:predicted  nucleic acid-binding Zn-ribbon protein
MKFYWIIIAALFVHVSGYSQLTPQAEKLLLSLESERTQIEDEIQSQELELSTNKSKLTELNNQIEALENQKMGNIQDGFIAVIEYKKPWLMDSSNKKIGEVLKGEEVRILDYDVEKEKLKIRTVKDGNNGYMVAIGFGDNKKLVTTQVLSNIKKIPYIWINQHKECKIELS